mmetsp:Transcript_17591/g.30294  ORF Transcript_17591/g.30294 Transcript_17591/m.30294 type:complete len:96 (-) Transcript_17591:232-519(-)
MAQKIVTTHKPVKTEAREKDAITYLQRGRVAILKIGTNIDIALIRTAEQPCPHRNSWTEPTPAGVASNEAHFAAAEGVSSEPALAKLNKIQNSRP